MTPQIALTLAIIGVAVVLFATEKLRVDVIALLVLVALFLGGLVSPGEMFAGFASPAVVTVWAVYIVSGALFKTGVADFLGERIIRLAGTSEPRLIAIIMLTCGVMSAFMNNIGATAVLLPAVVGVSRKANVPLSRLLIPLSFSSLLGGNMTLIGTPPNVLAAGLLADQGLPGFRFFDFLPTGAIVFGAGILYMVLAGRHLIPVRQPVEEVQAAAMREYVSEVRVSPDGTLAGQTLRESRLGAEYDLTVIGILRDDVMLSMLNPETRLEPGDLLFLEGTVEGLMRARGALGLEIEAERKWALDDLESGDAHVVEATLAPRSHMVGRTLRNTHFRDRYGFTALAIWRQGEVITQRLRDVRLRFGDALLLWGPRHRLPGLQEDGDFLVLEPVKMETRRQHKAPIAVGAMALVLILATLADLPIATAMVIGAVVTVLGGCLTMDEAYQSIEWRSVFLIAGMLPLGTAMETTGTARFLADLLVGLLGSIGPLAILAGIYILAGLITEPMSNAAATVLMVPIAIDIALSLGANPQPFVLATVIGASTSFLTPVGHQANVLVLGPGGYRFFDYTRVGSLLNLVILAVTLVFLPLIWPLF
ncbi:MAG: SLC13 family permease [Anaerolineaceae bacterium]|nr:SLC13 family permease [Anaerolineaceae bacterium]